MKVVFFHRKPKNNNFSVETTFQITRDVMPAEVNCVVAQSRFESKGFFRRLYNIFEAAFRQGDVNHITGDVHFLSYLLRRNRTLLTVLDCVFLYNSKGLKRFILRLLWGVIPEKRVALISVISQATKNELLECINCNPDKIRVVPVCISPSFTRFDKIFNADKPRILHVGTNENKNLNRLVRALEAVNCQLEIIGRLSAIQLEELEKSRIDFVNSYDLTDEEMIQKYIECDLLAFVSTYEGFGMPILEANAVGRPVITSNVYSMPEVAGDSACLVDPYDISDIRAGILRILSDAIYRKTLIRNGYRNALRFDPKEVARQYYELYKELSRDS
jgi:glycosyltransferase involved in cell wall biosynthesis